MAAIAKRIGAPTGSIYHRYASREGLLAELWLGVVEDFQLEALGHLEGDDPLEAAVRTALFVPRWVRSNLREARLLLLHNRQDFVPGAWPDELVERASALGPQLMKGVRDLCRRHYGRTHAEHLRRLQFALLDVPYGAVKPYLKEGRPPPPLVDELIETTCRAVLGQ